MLVVDYVRVSTEEQVQSGLGIEAQRSAIEAECNRRGLELTRIHEDTGASAGTMRGRPGLDDALIAVHTGAAEALIVAKLDRLSRSVSDFSKLLEHAAKGGWSLIALDPGVDTTTPQGEGMANVAAVFAQLERRLIGQRTRDALAAKRAQGLG